MAPLPLYTDREDAARKLSQYLTVPAGALLLALPRGGVPIGAILAARFRIPLTVLVVRKLGAPTQPELAVGAIAEGGIRIMDERTIRSLTIDVLAMERVVASAQAELERRVALYRGNIRLPDLRGKTVILTDDGLATGLTMTAAIASCRALHAGRIMAAVPVGAAAAVKRLQPLVDGLVCPAVPPGFTSVSSYYRHFAQVSDGDVIRLLRHVPRPAVMHDTH